MGDQGIHTESGRGSGALFCAAIAAFLVAAPYVISDTPWLRIYTVTALYVMLAMGLNVVAGFAGTLDLAYVAFFGIGGYLFAVLSSGWLDIHLPFLAALPLAASTAMAVGLLLGSAAVRLKGEHLVVLTFAFAQIFRLLLLNLDRPIDITGGMHGIHSIDPVRFFGPAPISALSHAYLISLTAAAVVMGCCRLKRSHYGRGWQAVREDELAAQSAGISPSLMKLKAFAGGAFIAGGTGALFASFTGSVSPNNFDFPQLVIVYCMVILGGRGNVKGVVLGAVLLSLMSELVARGGAHRVMFFSLTLIVMIGLRPQGVMGMKWPATGKRREQDETAADRSARSLSGPAEEPTKGGGTKACRKSNRFVLEIKGVFLKIGGNVALEDVSFQVWEREILSIVGPNGAGKTALLNIISGYYPASSGTIVYGGKTLAGLKPHRIVRAGIARTFQNPRLFDRMSVLDNAKVARFFMTGAGILSVLLGLPLGRREERDAERKVKEVLAMFGNDFSGDRLTRSPLSLTPGDRRRLEIARAVSTGPKVLLLDEPSAGMGPGEAKGIADCIRTMRDRCGCTVILVEHNLQLVRSVSDRVVALAFGRKIAEGSCKEVTENPSFMNACLGTRNQTLKSPSAPF